MLGKAARVDDKGLSLLPDQRMFEADGVGDLEVVCRVNRDELVVRLHANRLEDLDKLPRRLGLLSQTTQIPASFARFAKELIDFALVKDSELRIIDTICHDIRRRQEDTLSLAEESDLMLVVGGHTSANSKHLVELCSRVTKTYFIETADEIQTSWLQDKHHIGITSGASTDEQTIDEVVKKLESLN